MSACGDEEREMILALGAAGWAQMCREMKALGEQTTERQNAVLAPQGYRHAKRDEPGAHFRWLKIDDRAEDDGLCKVWVVAL